MDYKKFNKFQNYFFTSIGNFNTFTDYEINEFSFLLFNSLTKAFPGTAQKYMYYNNFIKFDKCPELIRALQHKFVNRFTRARIPQAVFFKMGKKITVKKTAVKKGKLKFYEFDESIIGEIQSKLMIDSKTYESVKHTDKVQKLGLLIVESKEMKLKDYVTKQLNKKL